MSTQSKALLTFGVAICVTVAARNVAMASAKSAGLSAQQAALLALALSPLVARALR